jgi:hypothetical protein
MQYEYKGLQAITYNGTYHNWDVGHALLWPTLGFPQKLFSYTNQDTKLLCSLEEPVGHT